MRESTQPHTILCIHDPDSRGSDWGRVLSSAGCRVIRTAAGACALALAADEQPALIVVEVSAADPAGAELPIRLKSDPRTSRIPVLVASAPETPSGPPEADGLRLAKERYDRLFNHVREGLAYYKAIYDEGGRLADLLIEEINPAGARFFAVARDVLVGRTWRQVLPGMDAALLARFQEAVHSGDPVRFDYDNVPTGRTYDVIISHIEPGEFVVTFNDLTERRRAEEALRDTVRRYEQQVRLFDGVASTTPDFVYLFDLEGRFLYANRRLLEVWGMQLPDVIGKTCRELGYEQWHHDMHMREIAQVIETRRPIKGEVPFRAPLTGVFGVYEYIFTPVTGANGEVEIVAGTTRDITERKQAEEALRESEERFRALVTTTADAVFRASPDWTEMRYVHGRQFLADTVVPSRSWLDEYIHADDRQLVERAIQEAISSGSAFQLEHRVRREDGSTGWAFSRAIPLRNAKGEVIEWFGAASDITPRKEAEAALLASEARERARAAEMEAILEAAPVALFISQDPECRDMVGSRMTYEMLRLTPGQNVSKSAPEEQQPATFRAMRDGIEIPPRELPAQKAASSGQAVRSYEFDLVYNDGTCRNMLGDAVPLFDEQGHPRGSVGAFVDITERKRNEERLRQTQKLESIGLLAGGIAHDFNNLLTSILGNASLVVDEMPPDTAERIQEVITAAERAADLTRQLLAYSGKGQFFVQDLDISQAVQEIAELVQFSIPVSVQLAVTVEKRLPLVRMDPGQFQQIVMNLVINAGEAIGEGNSGRITVTTSMRDVETAFTDTTGKDVDPGRYVCLEITDTGSGISEDHKSKIFDPFFTTKFAGRGLGLAAVAGIVRSQKGGINVETRLGAGSTFRVFLRAAEVRFLEERPAAAARATVLVIEDERSVRDFIGAVLLRAGYRVLPASDGVEALALCEREGGVIDAAIIDIVMPRMGASDLLPALKALQPRIKVLLTSGYDEAEARRLCAAYPGAAFIQKPYTAGQISKAVESLLDAW